MNQSQILVVDDDSQLREAIVDTLMLTGYACIEASSGEEALSTLLKRHVDMVISDIQMGGMDGHTLLKSIHDKYPQLPVLLMTAYANIDGAVKAMRDGAIDYLAKPFAPEVLLSQVSRYVPVKRITKREPIWADPSTGDLLQLAAKVAASDASVMITGPSGSGKEVLSRYVHDNSPRANGPFIAINCAAIPDTMLESTLFGYEKGAFTGAVQACPGKFEQAQGGTILLDEITEMDLGLQAKLLRVLQEREVERLGSRKTISLDVRVIATSNRDLKQAVAERKFREDLYYRLNVFPLKWRPLGQRIKDVIPLAKFFLQRYATESSKAILELSDEAIERLESYSWPGNVRELENVMQRALILSDGAYVKAKDLILDDLETTISAKIEGLAPELRQEQSNSNISTNEEVVQKAYSNKSNSDESSGGNTSYATTNREQESGINGDSQAINKLYEGREQDLNKATAFNTTNAMDTHSATFNANVGTASSLQDSNIKGVQGEYIYSKEQLSTDNHDGNMLGAGVASTSGGVNSLSTQGLGNQSNQNASWSAAAKSVDMVRSQKIPSNLGGELKQQEYQIIFDALVEFRGNRQAVAEKLGISPRTLRYKIAKMRDEGMIIPS